MKPHANILEPDPRFRNMAAGFDATGAVRMMSIGYRRQRRTIVEGEILL
jgi:hypothetical protein